MVDVMTEGGDHQIKGNMIQINRGHSNKMRQQVEVYWTNFIEVPQLGCKRALDDIMENATGGVRCR